MERRFFSQSEKMDLQSLIAAAASLNLFLFESKTNVFLFFERKEKGRKEIRVRGATSLTLRM